MAYQYQNNLTNNYYPQQPMFPQPQGNVYVIQSSVEVANIPAGAGITAAICMQENILYMKSMQNGMPMFLAYKLIPYTESPKSSTTTDSTTLSLEDRIVELERQMATVSSSLKDNPKDTAKTATQQNNTNWDT